MELDEISQSGIRRIADFSPYLDQLAGLAQDMGLSQRSNLVDLEKSLHRHWSLGQNSILSWAPLDDGILILVCRRVKQVGSQGETAVIVSDGQAARTWVEWDGSDESRNALESAYDKFAEEQYVLPGVAEDDLLDADDDEDDDSLL